MTALQQVAVTSATTLIISTNMCGAVPCNQILLTDTVHNYSIHTTVNEEEPTFKFLTDLTPVNENTLIKQTLDKPDLFDKIEGELASYLHVKDNWDYEGGVIPSEIAVKSCIELLNKIKEYNIKPPTPMLIGDGEVCLYWKKSDLYIEVGFEEDNQFSYLVDNRTEPFSEDNCAFNNFAKTKLYTALLDISIN